MRLYKENSDLKEEKNGFFEKEVLVIQSLVKNSLCLDLGYICGSRHPVFEQASKAA
ncbi:hypothetical protein RYX36_036535 [Vicia faba]